MEAAPWANGLKMNTVANMVFEFYCAKEGGTSASDSGYRPFCLWNVSAADVMQSNLSEYSGRMYSSGFASRMEATCSRPGPVR